jgi:Raf kinase inhibitor-like YbhB/YbcL family protein
MFGADAPTLSGFWHWAVVNIPAHITSLARGAGDDAGEAVPRGAKQLPNDLRAARYVGANPQAGFREFRYFFIVWALNLKRIDLPSYATPAYFQLQTDGHVVGRATLVANASDAPGSSRNAAYWGHT